MSLVGRVIGGGSDRQPARPSRPQATQPPPPMTARSAAPAREAAAAALLPLALAASALAQVDRQPPPSADQRRAADSRAAPAAPAAGAPMPPPPPPAAPQGGTDAAAARAGQDHRPAHQHHRADRQAGALRHPDHHGALLLFHAAPARRRKPRPLCRSRITAPTSRRARVFSGWMYGSSPGLNGVEHPLYDVWVISCNNSARAGAVAGQSPSTAPVQGGRRRIRPTRKRHPRRCRKARGPSRPRSNGQIASRFSASCSFARYCCARNFHGAEPRQMRGEELGVQQREAAALQPLHQMHQRHLAGVALAGEHAFAEKRRAQPHAIKPAHQLAVLPAFDRMGMAAGMQRGIEAQDLAVDPAFLAPRRRRGAGLHHVARRPWSAVTVKRAAAHGAGQAARHMETVQRNDAALFRRHPVERGIVAPLAPWETGPRHRRAAASRGVRRGVPCIAQE